MAWLRNFAAIVGSCMLLLLGGCASAPDFNSFFQPVSLEQRQTRIRVYETADEISVLKACSSVLLDNGFQIHEAESRLGWLNARKVKRSPTLEPVLAGVTVLVYPAPGKAGATALYLNLQQIDDPEIYQELFARIATALFLKEQRL
jgi:DNA-binding transcriptional MerR regulator